MTLLADLSHTIDHGMITYKGLPAPLICDYLSREASRRLYAPGTEFQIGKIEMVGTTGTYLDAPFHRFPNGKDLTQLSLDRVANLRCVVAHLDHFAGRAIDTLPLAASDVHGCAVLIHTDWARHWRTDQYFEGHPFLTGAMAQWLADAGAVLVGIDSYNIDSTQDSERPVHTTLLRQDIPIVEHLCGLGELPQVGSRFFAVPPKVTGFGTFPVRAYALVD